jgi:hypothetical protein
MRRVVAVLVALVIAAILSPAAEASTPAPPAGCALNVGAFTIHQGTVAGHVWVQIPGYACNALGPTERATVERRVTATGWQPETVVFSGQQRTRWDLTRNAIGCLPGWRYRLHVIIWWGSSGIRSDYYSQNVPGFTSTALCPR